MRKALRKAGAAPRVPSLGYSKTSCAMRRRATVDEVQDGEPGDFIIQDCAYSGKTVTSLVMYHKLPNGDYGAIPLRPLPKECEDYWRHADGKVHSWQWNGNADAPTLQPSVRRKPDQWRTGWHGWIKAGQMENCE